MKEPELIDRLADDADALCSNRWRERKDTLPGKQAYFSLLDSVNESYEVFISFFKDHVPLSPEDVLLASHFIHAWKSEKLTRGTSSWIDAARVLNQARIQASRDELISPEEFQTLVELTSDSCVSMATKLLHLAVPGTYGILDRHVYRYLTGGDWEQALQVYGLSSCYDYWGILHNVIKSHKKEVMLIHQDVIRWLGYEVATIRALELVMYVRGKLASLGMELESETVLA